METKVVKSGGEWVVNRASLCLSERVLKMRIVVMNQRLAIDLAGAPSRRSGRDLDVMVRDGSSNAVVNRLRASSPEAMTVESMSLEEIYVATLGRTGAAA